MFHCQWGEGWEGNGIWYNTVHIKIVLPGPVELLGTLNVFDGREQKFEHDLTCFDLNC